MYSSLNQVMNPTDEQRHEMLRNSLENAGRPEDYDYIIRLLSPAPDITNYASPGDLRGVKIGILGGGLAGMSAAYELRKLGADITVFEASDERIGGRVYTFYFDQEGKYYGEFGAMRIPVTHEATWHYINLFGLNTLSMTSPKRNNFLYVHNTRIRTTDSVEEYLYPKYELTEQERNTPWRELNDYAFEYRFLQLPPEIRAELISVLPNYSPEFIPLMEMSLRENFENLGLSQGAINLISGADPASGALLQNSYDEIAHEEYTFDYINTYRIQGGNVYLPLAFYNSFDSASPPGYDNISSSSIGTVTYKTGHTITGIYQSDYRNKVIIKCRTRAGENDAADIFDYIICTIPFSVLRTVEIKPFFSNMKMQAIQELNYIDAQKTLFLCNRRFWERNTDYGNMIGGISFTDLPIQSIIYPSDHNQCLIEGTCTSEEPGVLTSSYNLAQNAIRLGGMEEYLRYEVVRQNVEEVHGLPRGFLTPFVERYQTVHWINEPLYRGALAYTLPGQKGLFSYEMQQPEYSSRVFFAGEHVSNKHGWMQGALSSGKAAANSLAAHFNNQY
jgi:monoamine oxidase